MAVDTPTIQYKAMAEKGAWDLCMDLLGGTPTMRSAGTKWTPKEPDEKQKNYNVRIKRSFLYNAYDDTIEKYVARPFSRPATWDVKDAEAKAAMEPVMLDMDGEGLYHQDFAKEYFRMLLRWGVSTAYVDYPEIDNPEDTTKGDEQDDELRPINSVLKTPGIIGWETEEKKNGVEELSQIRVKESYIEDKDNWEQQAYDQIRVIDKDKWTLYRREKKKGKAVRLKDDSDWAKAGTGNILIDGEVPDFLPLVTAYTNKLGLMVGMPAFLNQAWTNLELWQSASDQKNILRFDRMGILFGSGWTEDEKAAGITVAPTSASLTENPDATLDRVETNGKPAENGWKDIRDIMERLEVQGMDPMVQRMANVKAAGINANEDKSRSMIESWIDAANTAMRKIIQMNLKWMGFDVALDDIEYNINQDFVFATKTSQEVKDVIEMRKNGDIGLVDFIKEMQRYGRIADGNAIELAARATADRAVGTGLFEKAVGRPGEEPAPLGEAALFNAADDQTTVGAGL